MLNTSPSGHSGCHTLSDTHPPGPDYAPAANTACPILTATNGTACYDHPSSHVHQHRHYFLAGHDQPCWPQLHQCGWLCLVQPFTTFVYPLNLSICIFFFHSLDLFAAGTTGQYLIYHSAESLFYAFSLHIKYSLKYTVYVSMFLRLCVCVCLGHSSPQTLMAGSNPMLGCSPGINLSGILPSGGLMPSALPTMQPAASAGIHFPSLTHLCWEYLPCLWFA